jgi:hypothetical protein
MSEKPWEGLHKGQKLMNCGVASVNEVLGWESDWINVQISHNGRQGDSIAFAMCAKWARCAIENFVILRSGDVMLKCESSICLIHDTCHGDKHMF